MLRTPVDNIANDIPNDENQRLFRGGDALFSGRINVIRVIFFLFFVTITARLVTIQWVNSSYYSSIAKTQYETKVVLKANRGLIYDRNGSLIVSNSYGYSFAADPELLDSHDRELIARKFAAIFGKPISFFMNKLNTNSRFVWLARDVRPDQSEELRKLRIYGLIQLQEQKRLYPYGTVAGQVIGFTNVDGKGASGVELEFDSLLSGKDGFEIMQRDGIGRRMQSVDYPRVDPVPGCNVQLTLDMNIEQIVEDELAAGVEEAKGIAGTAVFINPITGEVLAIANYPSFDPSQYERYTPDDFRDRAITDAFEPGSTFKVVTASAALEEGVEKPNNMIFAENGKYVLYGKLIEDFERKGWITFRQAVEYSSNIAFSKVGLKISADKFYRYARDFGFGAPTGIELPGEVPGELKKPYEWSRLSLPFMSFGYEVMVTALQMADAYAAIANGGTLMKPYIVRKITDSQGNVLFQNTPVPIRRVVSRDVAQTLSGLFVDVVEHGTGSLAKLNDLLIAGKTGTAQKLIDGKYSKKFYRASFAGFFPVPNPEIVGFIMVDSPMKNYTGGAVAAPIFRRIASRIYGIMQKRTVDLSKGDVRLVSNSSAPLDENSASESRPSDTQVNGRIGSEGGYNQPSAQALALSNKVDVPDVSFLDFNTAAAILRSRGLVVDRAKDYAIRQSDESKIVVQSEVPAAGAVVPRGSIVRLSLIPAMNVMKMPDFCGASVRKAASFSLAAGIPFRVVGSGKIISQYPPAGQRISRNVLAIFTCESEASSKKSPDGGLLGSN
jgi:cell division protein FtsI (penicillin-binding protein 3)